MLLPTSFGNRLCKRLNRWIYKWRISTNRWLWMEYWENSVVLWYCITPQKASSNSKNILIDAILYARSFKASKSECIISCSLHFSFPLFSVERERETPYITPAGNGRGESKRKGMETRHGLMWSENDHHPTRMMVLKRRKMLCATLFLGLLILRSVEWSNYL